MTLPALVLLGTLAGCGDGSNGVGGVSPGEAKALNDAAEMLDSRAVVATEPTGDMNLSADRATP